MVTVISNDLFNQGNLNNLMELNTTEYIHVSSKVRKLAIINLGMTDSELNSIKSVPASLNLFNKGFNNKVLASLENDCCILTSGSLNKNEIAKVVENIKPLIGKTKLIGIGVGKEILMEASNQTGWESMSDHSINTDLNMVGFDSNLASLVDVLK